jgi:pimeloyl-ACP methyl ester carboxylesterase
MKKKMLIAIFVSVGIICGIKICLEFDNFLFNRKIEYMRESGLLDLKIEINSEHKVSETPASSIHYFTSGDKTKEAVLFLHPAFSDHRCFDKQLDYFSKKYRMITVDLSGHGLSNNKKNTDKIDQSARHIAGILKSEDIRSVHVVGVSMGALIAQDFADKYPDMMLSLTVLGGYDIHKEDKEIAALQRKEMFGWLFRVIFSMNSFREYAASSAVTSKVSRAHFYETTKLFTRSSFRSMSKLNDLVKESQSVQRTYPLLILIGENDTKLALKVAKNMHKEEANSEYAIIERAGHCANMDNSFAFNRRLDAFIEYHEMFKELEQIPREQTIQSNN